MMIENSISPPTGQTNRTNKFQGIKEPRGLHKLSAR
jgi:hypothetical protein